MSIRNSVRFQVLKRDGFKCVYCGRSASEVEVEIDHAHARSKGGTDDIENLVTSCFECNRGKAANSVPRQAKSAPKAVGKGLIDKCFIAFTPEGKFLYQGIVKEKISENQYMIQYFSWIDGSPNTMKMVTIEEMFGPNPRFGQGWEWFEDHHHMRAWTDDHQHLGH